MAFVIRDARPDDLDDLYRLAKQTFFINLPPDRDIIAGKLDQSRRSFAAVAQSFRGSGQGGSGQAGASPRSSPKFAPLKPGAKPHSAGISTLTAESELFVFVIEDTADGTVVGTSQVIAHFGGSGQGRVFFELSERKRASTSLKMGLTHQVGTMGTDESGPTEVGGIIINHAFRRRRLGRFLSFVRFHLIGLFPDRFGERVIAEMLGPIDSRGYNPFFEKFTRRFIPYEWDAIYRFSQRSREFVTGLMPSEPVYLTVMEPDVAMHAGEVSEATRPARHILESIGFAYHNRIDPLDGGPHLEADTATILPVRSTSPVSFAPNANTPAEPAPRTVIASTLTESGSFRAIWATARTEPGTAHLSDEDRQAIDQKDVVLRGLTDIGPA